MGFPDRRTANVLFTILAFAVALGIIYVARTVLVIFAFAILFAYLIDPIVRFLQRHSLLWKRLRGPHVLEAYVVLLVAVALGGHALAPKCLQNARLLSQIPAVAEKVSSGEIATDMQENLGWSDANADRLKTFLQGHRSDIEKSLASIEGLVSGVAGAILVIPILAIFFLSDGEHLADSAVRLISTRETYASIRSLADELHIMLQHYIRAKVTLAVLSLTYCSIAMLVLRFPNPFALGVLAGILEFIPVAGWMLSAATITTVGILTHSHWIWMLALLGLWRVLMDYLIAPRVMGHELEIHPLLAIFTFMVGGAVGESLASIFPCHWWRRCASFTADTWRCRKDKILASFPFRPEQTESALPWPMTKLEWPLAPVPPPELAVAGAHKWRQSELPSRKESCRQKLPT